MECENEAPNALGGNELIHPRYCHNYTLNPVLQSASIEIRCSAFNTLQLDL